MVALGLYLISGIYLLRFSQTVHEKSECYEQTQTKKLLLNNDIAYLFE